MTYKSSKPTKITKRNFSVRNIISTVLLVFALGILFYPIIVNYMVSQQNKTTIQNYNQSVDKMNPQKVKQLLQSAHLYNQYIYTKSQYKTWDKPIPDYDEQLITDKTKVIAHLTIPQIKVENVPVYSGDSAETLAAGIGHIPQTSLPVGGHNTHSVLSAHSGHVNNTLFSDLEDLKLNDVFYIHVLDKTLKYKIIDRKIVNPDETDAINIVNGKDLVTLVTCWPTGINNKRLLVTGTRLPNDSSQPQEHIQRNKYGYNFWVMSLASALALVALYLIIRNIFGKHTHNMRIDRIQFDAIYQGKQTIVIASAPPARNPSSKYKLKDKIVLTAAEVVHSRDVQGNLQETRQYFTKKDKFTWVKIEKRKYAEQQKGEITRVISAQEFNNLKENSDSLLPTSFIEAAEKLAKQRLGTSLLPENYVFLEIKVKR